jgi:hypothetical protein
VAVGSVFTPHFDPATHAFTGSDIRPWVQIAGAPQPVAGTRSSWEQLAGVSCRAGQCTAVGARVTPNDNSVPLIAQGPA